MESREQGGELQVRGRKDEERLGEKKTEEEGQLEQEEQGNQATSLLMSRETRRG